MKKGNESSIITRVLTIFACLSFVVTFIVGMYYYSPQEYADPLIRYLLVVQNSIKAFWFDSDISLSDISELFLSTESLTEHVLYHIYSVAVFVAPFCTVVTLYKMLESLLHFKTWGLFSKNKTHVIVFGYNDVVADLLSTEQKPELDLKTCRIHVVADKMEHEDEIRLLKKGIIVHKIDFLKTAEDAKSSVFKKIELKRANYIIIYEESEEKNFAVFHLLNRIKDESKQEVFNKKVKIFCRNENWGIRKLVEVYYDNKVKESESAEQSGARKTHEGLADFEIINPEELVTRKLFKEKPLHSFYKENNIAGPENWHLHLLIVGLNNLGQQILLQAMNMGVVSSSNRIIIDVVDKDIDKKRNSFICNFSDDYVDYEKGEVSVPGDKIDGKLLIRFHNSDATDQTFFNLLCEYGSEKNGGKFTYAAMCMKDFSAGSLCALQMNRYFKHCKEFEGKEKPCIAVCCVSKEQEVLYRNALGSNVVMINDGAERLTLKDLLAGDLDYESKAFHGVYSSLEVLIKGSGKGASTRQSNEDYDELWKRLSLYKRNSNRAAAQHAAVKEDIFAPLDKALLDGYFGKNGELLHDTGNAWEFATTLDAFVDSQCDFVRYPLLHEMSVMEHRRWSYFVISCGWGRTAGPEDKANEKEKVTPCLCTWEDLATYKRDVCHYDMMWLLLKYRESQE